MIIVSISVIFRRVSGMNICVYRLHIYICVILDPYLCTNVVQSNHDMLILIGVKELFANLESVSYTHLTLPTSDLV